MGTSPCLCTSQSVLTGAYQLLSWEGSPSTSKKLNSENKQLHIFSQWNHHKDRKEAEEVERQNQDQDPQPHCSAA